MLEVSATPNGVCNIEEGGKQNKHSNVGTVFITFGKVEKKVE